MLWFRDGSDSGVELVIMPKHVRRSSKAAVRARVFVFGPRGFDTNQDVQTAWALHEPLLLQ